MSTSHGYSDRISHAFAFAAKHLQPRMRRGSGALHLTQPANVAVILARYGCDEITIISGILSHLVNEASYGMRPQLANKIAEKFGAMVSQVIDDVAEPRYDSRGRERNWEVCRMDYLANLSAAGPRALDICAANQIHLCGSTLTDIRRLGVEYLSAHAEAPAEQTLWWYGSVITALEAVPSGPRTGMLLELKGLLELLGRELEQQGG
ncbi:MAG TPA: HD domain-containing protein [Gemmatimonadales bacterium]|nr:HD domain-containing protein [Gemmatimonadales bacterium]